MTLKYGIYLEVFYLKKKIIFHPITTQFILECGVGQLGPINGKNISLTCLILILISKVMIDIIKIKYHLIFGKKLEMT